MRVLVDTPIWSAALRRADGKASLFRAEFSMLVQRGVVEIIGPIRQEVLSGIRDPTQFERVRRQLRSFVDLAILVEDHEEAASYYNHCRARGIQGSFTDYLICAIAARHNLAIFTDDRDFNRYARIIPIRLYAVAQT